MKTPENTRKTDADKKNNPSAARSSKETTSTAQHTGNKNNGNKTQDSGKNKQDR